MLQIVKFTVLYLRRFDALPSFSWIIQGRSLLPDRVRHSFNLIGRNLQQESNGLLYSVLHVWFCIESPLCPMVGHHCNSVQYNIHNHSSALNLLLIELSYVLHFLEWLQ